MDNQNKTPGASGQPATAEPDEAVDSGELHGEGWAVILYDDNVHIRDDVVAQVMKALRCRVSVAEGIVARVESQGKGVVTIAEYEEAKRVDDILREIGLKTELKAVV